MLPLLELGLGGDTHMLAYTASPCKILLSSAGGTYGALGVNACVYLLSATATLYLYSRHFFLHKPTGGFEPDQPPAYEAGALPIELDGRMYTPSSIARIALARSHTRQSQVGLGIFLGTKSLVEGISQAHQRTRTADPFLTTEALYQLS